MERLVDDNRTLNWRNLCLANFFRMPSAAAVTVRMLTTPPFALVRQMNCCTISSYRPGIVGAPRCDLSVEPWLAGDALLQVDVCVTHAADSGLADAFFWVGCKSSWRLGDPVVDGVASDLSAHLVAVAARMRRADAFVSPQPLPLRCWLPENRKWKNINNKLHYLSKYVEVILLRVIY